MTHPLENKRKAFVLYSGGIDSTTCLYIAKNESPNVSTVSINYGQKHSKEMEIAKQLAEDAGATHEIIDLPGALSGKNVMLTDRSVEIPDISYEDIQGISPTFVPFRNGTMLSIITAHVQKYILEVMQETNLSPDSDKLKDLCTIYFGAHAEDAHNWAYPDCTPEFIGAMQQAIYIGSYRTIRLKAPLTYMDKSEVIAKGHSLGAPLSATWSCYAGGTHHCGTCPTCRSRKESFLRAGVFDNTIYLDTLINETEVDG